MATNFPGPYEIRLFYTLSISTVTIQHEARYNLVLTTPPAPGTLFSAIDALDGNSVVRALDTWIDAWAALMQPLFSNTAGVSSLDYCELWEYAPASFDATFISTYALGLPGTTAAAAVAAAQNMIVFRTSNGGVMKLNFMETVIGPGAPDTLPFLNAPLDAIADYVVAGTSLWRGRDDGIPFACIALYPGTNEAIFKKRFRP